MIMIKVIANIKLYKNVNSRKTSFLTGYRPLFNFIKEMKKSGQIILKEKAEFFPGDEGVVEINFLDKKYLGDNFGLGSKFTFGEGGEPFGEGEIIEVLVY